MIETNARKVGNFFEKFGNSFYKKTQEEQKNTRKILGSLGKNIKRRILSSMQNDPKTGRVYFLPGGKTHQASAPGESPAILSKKLYNSIDYKIRSLRREMEIGARNTIDYPKWLEQGTTNRIPPLLPRPYLVNNVKKEVSGIKAKILQSALDIRIEKNVGWYIV